MQGKLPVAGFLYIATKIPGLKLHLLDTYVMSYTSIPTSGDYIPVHAKSIDVIPEGNGPISAIVDLDEKDVESSKGIYDAEGRLVTEEEWQEILASTRTIAYYLDTPLVYKKGQKLAITVKGTAVGYNISGGGFQISYDAIVP